MARKKKNKKAEEVAPVVEEVAAAPAEPVAGPTMDGTPIAPPMDEGRPLQLSPIIQPIAFVPYSTQNQELYMWEEEDPYYGADPYAQQAYAQDPYAAPYYGGGYALPPTAPEAEDEEVEEKPRKKVSVAAIFLILISILAIVLIVVGKYANMTYLYIVGGMSGLDAIIGLFSDMSSFGAAQIAPLMILISAACAVLILLFSLIFIMKRGACVIAKIASFIGLVAVLVVLILGLMKREEVTVDIGIYILTGLMLLCVLIAFGSKNNPKVKKNK